MRRSFCPSSACARCRNVTRRSRSCSSVAGCRHAVSLRARRIGDRRSSAAIRTGAARSGCRSITCSSKSLYEFHRYYGDDFMVEFPVGSGRARDPGRDRRRIARAAGAPVPARRGRAAALPRPGRLRHGPGRPSATICCSTSTSTATPARGSAPRTRPAGRGLIALLLHPRDPHNPCLLDVTGPDERGTTIACPEMHASQPPPREAFGRQKGE